MAHMPDPRRETSTVVASPVRSRWKSAPMMPPAMVMAPTESPKPGPGGAGIQSASAGLTPRATPARYQKDSES